MKFLTKSERVHLNMVRQSNRSGSMMNVFRYHKQNTSRHEMLKFNIFKYLIDNGHNVITEAILDDGQRIDVFDISLGIAYEVMESETVEKLNQKTYKVETVGIKTTNKNWKGNILI